MLASLFSTVIQANMLVVCRFVVPMLYPFIHKPRQNKGLPGLYVGGEGFEPPTYWV